jgi:kynureninase
MDVVQVEEQLKQAGFEIDTRPPNIMRITAHYGYTRFEQIHRFVNQLKLILDKQLVNRMQFMLFSQSQEQVEKTKRLEPAKFAQSKL